MAVDAGLSSADLRQRAAAANLARKNGDTGATATDAMDQIVSDARKRLAITTASKLASDSATEEIEAETKRLEAEAKRQEIRERVKGGGPDNEWQKFVVERVSALEDANRELSERLSQQQMAALADQLSILKAELARLQSQPIPEKEDRIEATKRGIQDARALIELVSPPALMPPPPTGDAGPDPALEAWSMRAKLDHEWRMLNHESEVQIKKYRVDSEMEIKREEIRVQNAHLERIDKVLEKYGPKALELADVVVKGVWGGQGAGPVAADARPDAEVVLPEGVHVLECKCGAKLYYRDGFGGMICQSCGFEYRSDSASTSSSNGAHANTVESEEEE